MREFNQRKGRNTEMAQGVHSFDEVFYQSYEKAIIVKATPEQRRLWLLSPETVTVRQDSTITLKAGSAAHYGRNRYEHPELTQYIGKQLVVRYDNQNLHDNVFVYSKDGGFICEAECIEDTGFGDTHTARTYNRKRKQAIKATQEAFNAEVDMTVLEDLDNSTDVQPSAIIDSKVVRPATVKLDKPAQQEAPKVNEKIAENVISSFEDRKHSSDPMMSGMERYEHWLLIDQAVKKGLELNNRQQKFYEGFPQTSEYASAESMFEDFEMEQPELTDESKLLYASE